MRLDLCVLLIGKSGRLVDNRLRNTDLSHIVQQTDHIDLLLLLFGKTCPARDLPRILRHAGRVSVRISILRIDRTRERLHDLHRYFFQLFMLL